MSLNEEIRRVSKVVENIHPDDLVILSHPDHDGLTATVLFNAYFIKQYGSESRILYPTKERPYRFIFHKLIDERPPIFTYIRYSILKNIRILLQNY